MRRLLGLIAFAPALALLACGEERRAAPALAPVRLAVDAPADGETVEDRTVEVRGRVEPAAATVRVAGETVDVAPGGRFSATVALEAGPNIVDVQAAAPRHPASMTAIRITRQVPVEIPDLRGRSPEEAVAALEALGLQPELDYRGGVIDALLPGSDGVCGTDPAAGERVRVGTPVLVEVRKSC